MRAEEIAAINARLSERMGAQVGMKASANLPRTLRRAGRRLPRAVRIAGDELVVAEERAQHPRLAHLADPARLAQAETRVERYLDTLDPETTKARRRAGLFAELGFRIFVVLGLTLAVIVWQGLA